MSLGYFTILGLKHFIVTPIHGNPKGIHGNLKGILRESQKTNSHMASFADWENPFIFHEEIIKMVYVSLLYVSCWEYFPHVSIENSEVNAWWQ